MPERKKTARVASRKEAQKDDTSAMWGEQSSRQSADAKRGRWFSESKFAMIIHWGLYSEAAGRWQGRNYYGIAEWIMHAARIPAKEYEKLARRFNPVEFDARQWVRLAKAAGMKYIVITAKHHDGFAMFKSRVDKYNIVDATPFKRDPLRELAEACREGGLKLGFYYSQYQDWHDPDAGGNDWDFPRKRDFDRYLRAKAMPQIEELLTNYGPIGLIWFDTPCTISPEASRELLDLVHRLQPDCLVNSRIGNDLGDYVSLGDQEVPLTAPDRPWETIDTHNDTWAYAWFDHKWKTPKELVSRLVRVASLGGNYMLNVGPTGKGVVPAESAAIIRQVGDWVRRNPESIYGTVRSPLGRQAWGVSTFRPGRLYLHILDWPQGGELWVPGLKAKVGRATFLAGGKRLSLRRKGDNLCIQMPPLPPDPFATVIVLDVDGPVKVSRQTIHIHPGLRNELNAPFAITKGCRHGRRGWMERFGDWHHADVIEDWKKSSSASWQFSVIEPGAYNLRMDYDCSEAANYSEFGMTLSDTRWTFPALCTGGPAVNRNRFRNERLGMVNIAKAGDYTLTIRGLDVRGKNDFILRRLTLEPF